MSVVGTRRARDAWIAPGQRSPDAACRLICFSHAGGGSALYAPWRTALAPTVDVCPVVLPGRQGRLTVPPVERMEDLLDPLLEGLAEADDRPVALFGHSLGSIIAYEVARRFTAAGRPPAVLFVSARRAPHLPSRLPDVHVRDQAGLLAELRLLGGTADVVLDDAQLLELFLPVIRADFRLNETYQPPPGVGLGCDVVALGGTEDAQATREELQAWGDVTTGGFARYLFDGGHFYLQPPPSRLLRIVSDRLARAVAAGGPATE